MNNSLTALAMALLGIMGLTGCLLSTTSPPAQALPLEVLLTGTLCGARTPQVSASWIDRPDQMGRMLGGAAVAKPSSAWDPATEGALWIQMGLRRTGGFHLELAHPTATLKEGVATIVVRLITPGPEQLTTQALTAPCLLLKMSKLGVAAIDLRDPDGAQLFSLKIPAAQ
jgi:hypothetical protein